MSAKFEYIQTENYAGFPSIEIKDVSGFIKYAESLAVKYIFYIENNHNGKDGLDSEQSDRTFYFPVENIIYRIESSMYSYLEDYADALKNGFDQACQYYDARKKGCVTFIEYKQLKELDINDMEAYSLAQKGGYVKGFEEFKKKIKSYLNTKATSVIPDDLKNPIMLMQYASGKGFHNYKEFEKVYDLGFPDIFIYNEAVSKGFKSSNDFYTAVQGGFNDWRDYEEAKRLSIQSRQEYDNYKYFKNCGPKAMACDEYIVYEIIKKEENGSVISFKDLKSKFNEEQAKYRITFAPNGDNAGNHDMKIIPLWFSQNLAKDENVKKFLLQNEDIKKNGFFDEDKEAFEVFRVSKAKVYIDASNVTRHSNEDSNKKARFSNLQLIVDELKSRGFSEIVAIADASLRHHAVDYHVLSQLKKEINYYEVPSHTTADEFIIENARREKCLIISNDTFSDWKRKDKWIAHNIDYIRIPFLIAENKATMPALKAVLNGG